MIRHWVSTLLSLIGIAALVVGSTAQAQPSYPYPYNSVLPILFCPLDWSVNSAEVQSEASSLMSAMGEIQQFYGRARGDNTFILNNLVVLQGEKFKEGYNIRWNGGNIYTDGVEFTGNMEAAVVEELYGRGFPTPPAQNESGYSVLIFVKGAGGYAGARELGNADGGWGILGDWAIDSIQGQVPEGEYWWSGRRLQIGAAAHELGHTFGLPHPDAYNGDWSTTVMGDWWNYPNVGLNQWDKDYLTANKSQFFTQPINAASAPEPGASFLIAVGFVCLALTRTRYARRVAPIGRRVGVRIAAALALGFGALTAAYAQIDDADTLLYLPFENSLVGTNGSPAVVADNLSFVPGISGQGVQIGAGSRLSYSNGIPAALFNIRAQEGTIEFFVKPEWNGNDFTNHDFLTWGVGGGMILVKDAANNLRIFFNRFGIPDPEQNVGIGVGNWKAGDWHYVAYAWSEFAGFSNIYLDGELAATAPITRPLNTPFVGTFDIGTDNGVNPVSGTLDEFRISRIPRTPEQIHAYYATFTGTAAAPEPGALTLFLSGAIGIGFVIRSRRNR